MKTTAHQHAAARLEGRAIVGLMRKHNLTIRAFKAKCGITLKRIREVRQDGVDGLLAHEWIFLITGRWPDQ